MSDIEQRLRKTFSAMAGNEALSDVPDEAAAALMLKWSEAVIEHAVRQTEAMDDASAEEFLAPRLTSLRKLMRAVGHWATETDPAVKPEWWAKVEQHARALYGEEMSLPALPELTSAVPASLADVISAVRDLIDSQAPKG